MATSPVRFLLKASGPAQLRRRLRAARARLQQAAGVGRGLNRVATRIPSAVFGGDLLATLSGHLKDVLTPPSRSSEANAPRHRGVAADCTESAVRPSVRQGQAAMSQLVEHPRWSSRAASGRVGIPAAFSTLSRNGESTLAAFDELAADILDAPITRTERHEIRERANKPWPDSTPDVATNPGSQPVPSVLGKRIREYSELTGAQSRRQPVMALPDLVPGTPRDASAPATRPSHPRSLWPDRASKAVADTLQRFTGASFPNQNEILESAAQPTRQTAATSHPHALAPEHDADTVNRGSLRDLSDRMADVLRTQALQHGIDLT